MGHLWGEIECKIRLTNCRSVSKNLRSSARALQLNLRYGFAGTLTAAAIGSAVILGLAMLSAFTTFKIETWGLVAIAVIVLIGTVAFGFLSLWELPRIVAKFRETQFSINPPSRSGRN